MSVKKSNESRRKLLKSIAAGGGAVVAGKTLPESWSRPVVDSVMLPAHAQTSGTTLNSNGPITSGVAEVTDSDAMMANHESLLESFIPSAHAQASCAVIGQCATVNFIGDNGTVTVTNVGSGPFTLDESNIAGGTVGGIPFVLRLNADRSAGNLNFNGDCGGAGASLTPNAGCTPVTGESPEEPEEPACKITLTFEEDGSGDPIACGSFVEPLVFFKAVATISPPPPDGTTGVMFNSLEGSATDNGVSTVSVLVNDSDLSLTATFGDCTSNTCVAKPEVPV